MSVAILGSGAFGTALACVLAENGQDIWLWSRSNHQTRGMAGSRTNVKLPDVTLPDSITPTSDIDDIADASVVLLAVPAQQTSAILEKFANRIPDVPVVLCAKGIDLKTFQLQTDIAAKFLPNHGTAVLTGPGFATEIARGLPTALTLSYQNLPRGEELQRQLSTERMRLYLTQDMIGTQLGGALKNVIAIGAGIVMGARLGESARAALVTRGFTEMRRLGVAMGGQEETFAGLSGLGDLMLTCGSKMSRNFAAGFALGSGAPNDATQTVEGIATATAACALATKYNVEMPITRVVAAVLGDEITVEQAVSALLTRPLKQE